MNNKFNTIKVIILIVVMQFLFESCISNKTEIKRPREVWVFRSVLDKQARMVTAALDENLWLAYNTKTASLYKAWKGGVLFDGAVYTTKHGPQPTSLGYAYYTSDHKEQWVLLKSETEIIPKIQYKGHRFENNGVIFQFELETPEGEFITVEEAPEYLKKGDQNGLERNFRVTNNSSYKIALRTVMSSLNAVDDFSTNGNFNETDKKVLKFDNGELIDIEGLLTLNNGDTKLSIYFHPGFDQFERKKDEKKEEVKIEIPLGAQLIEGSDCKACHNEKVKTVGPAYIAIAEKYTDNESTIKKLVKKVKDGGKGVWGVSPMTPHPDFSDVELEEMVKYVLSLDDNQKKAKNGYAVKYTLNQDTNPLDFKDELEKTNGKGLIANLYVSNPKSQRITYSKAPVMNAIADKIHVLSKSDFGEQDVRFKIHFLGEITIDKSSSYDFRLISDDGSILYINGKEVIDNTGSHGFRAVDGEVYLTKGKHQIKIIYDQGTGDGAVSFQWFNNASKAFEIVTGNVLSFSSKHIIKSAPYVIEGTERDITNPRPGDRDLLTAVHPSFTLSQARPESFHPRVGGIDFLSDDVMVVSTWDMDGSVFLVKNYLAKNPEDIKVTRIAMGLAEPLGIKVVDDEIYVLQKQELTKLIDHDGDEIIDEYKTISNAWKVSANFHEFAFGLMFKEGYFYATLATAILPGGASADPQIQDRGKVVKISKEDGSSEFVAFGLRTPNGIGLDVNDELFVADNQGDWLPASKIVHVQKGQFYGSHSVDPIGTLGLQEKLPLVWLPQDEIGNSPSQPTYLNIGPYKNQLIHGEVTHGGIKRVAYEEVEGQLQGVVFRFTQGIEAGVNRIAWAPDGSLVIGGIGVSGNWGQYGKLKYGLQRLEYNGASTFEMLKIKALSKGFEIEFTEPLAKNRKFSAQDINVQQWYYLPTSNYGGPKMDHEQLDIRTLKVSEDRKKVYVELDGLKENHLVYFLLSNALKSEMDKSLWTTEAWYTLNRIPKK